MLAISCWTNSAAADVGLDAASYRVLHALCSSKSMTASRHLNVLHKVLRLTKCTVLIFQPVICTTGAHQVNIQNAFVVWCVVMMDKNSQSTRNGKFPKEY